VFEDRHCNRAVPGIGNTPPVDPLPTPPLPIPDVPGVPTPEEAAALIPDELLQRINQFGFANAPGGAVPAPRCRPQGPYDLGGERTQYPRVKSR
jgi:hypothetical protein